MIAAEPGTERELVSWQIGRTPREPWRTAACCSFGFPTVIVSPSTLSDGERFPTWAWLTCPWLTRRCSDLESGGATSRWVARLAAEPALADRMREADRKLRELRLAESGGHDACPDTGIAGQRDPLAVKCLHAHVALALAGVDDPVGLDTLEGVGRDCPDAECAASGPARGAA